MNRRSTEAILGGEHSYAQEFSLLRPDGALVATVCGAFFLVAVRLAGEMVASFLDGLFGMASKKLGHAVGHKIRAFRAGLDTMRTFTDFAVIITLSLAMWGLITLAYLEGTQAFVTGPQRAAVTLAKCMVLMVGGGVLIKTRDADRFYRMLNQIALSGITIEGVAPADDDVNSVYGYLIGGEEAAS